MGQSRFTVAEIMRIIPESELPTASIAGKASNYCIKEATLYRWRATYKGLSTSEAKRLKVLEDQNRWLKKLVPEKELIMQSINEMLKKIFEPLTKEGVSKEVAAIKAQPAGFT